MLKLSGIVLTFEVQGDTPLQPLIDVGGYSEPQPRYDGEGNEYGRGTVKNHYENSTKVEVIRKNHPSREVIVGIHPTSYDVSDDAVREVLEDFVEAGLL